MSDYVFSDSERQILMSEGFIEGLEKIAASKPHLRESLDSYRSGWLGYWMEDHIAEAEKELSRLDAALKRLKQVSVSLERSKKVASNDPRIAQFKNDMNAIDGWTISLLETVFRIMAFMDQKRTRMKVSELSAAMTKLLNERQAEKDPFKKNPSHFAAYMKR